MLAPTSAKATAAMASIIAGARAAAKAYIEQNKAGAQAAGSLTAHQVVAEEEDFVYEQVGESVAASAKEAAEAQAKAKLEAVQAEYGAAAGARGGAISETPAVRKRKAAEARISPADAAEMAQRTSAAASELVAAAASLGLDADVDETGGDGSDAKGRRVRSRSNERD